MLEPAAHGAGSLLAQAEEIMPTNSRHFLGHFMISFLFNDMRKGWFTSRHVATRAPTAAAPSRRDGAPSAQQRAAAMHYND